MININPTQPTNEKPEKLDSTASTNESNLKESLIDRMRAMMPVANNGLSKDVKLPAFARYWLTHMKTDIKESTAYAYESAIANHICRAFPNSKLSEITADDVQLFIMSLTEGIDLDDPLSPKTIRNVHGVFHRMMQDAYDMGIIDENPAKHTKLPKVKKPEIIPMNNNQVHRFLCAITGHPLEIFFKLALFTGMRKSELIGLTWDCFNFEEGYIRVYRQRAYDRKKRTYYFSTVKNSKPRTIYPAPDVMEMMKRLYEREPNSRYVFYGTDINNHLTLSQVRKPFDALMNNINMIGFRFHDLRHTFAVLSIKAGVDMKTLSDTMGHYSVAFTLDTYAFALTDMKEECAKRMQHYLDKQKFKI